MFWKISKTKRFTYPKIMFRTKSQVLSNKNEKFKLEQTSIPFKIKQPDDFSPYEFVGTSVAYKVGTYCLKPY